MKYLHAAIFISLIILSYSGIGSAEFVFKNDGSIIKGSIVADDVATLSIRKEGSAIEKVNRKDIMRIIYTDMYLGKVYVRLTSGEVIEGYQVDEDRDNYFFRKDITKPEEFTIQRRKVMFIARTNPTDLAGIPSTEIIKITWSPPFKPAKFYKVYIRDVKNNETKFKIAGETGDLEFTLKDLQKSWSYEVYATAIAVTGEESLPSEKIIVNTLPESPEKLNIAEKLSDDGRNVTLTFTWEDVKDPESRVKSYTIYENENGERKKKGSSAGSEFIIKDFPAEGRHWFEVVAVNDLHTESAEIRAVYDAGYKVYIRGMGVYIYPIGTMSELASYGYGGLLDAGVSKKRYSIGIETGYLAFAAAEEIESMMMIPLLIELDYRIPLFFNFSVMPVVKAGVSYDTIKYIVRDKTDPLISSIDISSSFDPMVSAGVYLNFDISEKIEFLGRAEYSMIFQKSGRMDYAAISLGLQCIF
ncbi:MAG: hypothetical protein CVV49_12945 [Spirochaetae bacterium HGW-Spirochaetae-5]|nr:MAG: hypothetical protein CVV49_12945 [Spirochaetae bacterium HGW-Spirochaetae-5]